MTTEDILDYFIIGNSIAEYWEPYNYLFREQNLDFNYDREYKREYDKSILYLVNKGILVITTSRSDRRYLSLAQ